MVERDTKVGSTKQLPKPCARARAKEAPAQQEKNKRQSVNKF